jgi:dienelactone hydrolase
MRKLSDWLTILLSLAGIWLPFCGSGAESNLAAVNEGIAQPWTPEEIWRGIEVEKLPLEVQVIKAWEEDGCACQKLTFVSEVVEGVKIRVFGIFGRPTGAKRLPGILHIHGGGQTASLAWVQYWAKRGYACLTYDFCGKWENRTEYTDWGPLSKNCCMASNGVYQVHPTPRVCGWFHWALAGRRALTLLAQQPTVNADRLGIFGISVGGTLCWLVAGTDARVKAAVPIYGCGYNVDRRKAVYGLAPSEDQLIYQASLAPEAYAPYIKCPILFLSASNDHHGWMDDAFDALGAVQAITRQAFTPHYIHHIEPKQGIDLPLWMDWHLKQGQPFPETPKLELRLNSQGVLEAQVRGKEPAQVDFYYALGPRIPPSRFWRRVNGVKDASGLWRGCLPVVSIWDRISVFANVFYDSGVCLSTRLSQALPGQLGKARATLAPSLNLDDGGGALETWFFGPAYTDPNTDQSLLSSGEDEGRQYVSVNRAVFGPQINFTIASHIFSDPQFQGQPGAVLAFDCKGGFDGSGLTLSFSEGEWLPGGMNYKATVPQQELVGGWRTIQVPLSRFVNEKGTSPGSWSKVDRIQLTGVTTQSEPPRFSRFHWVMP